MSPALPMDGPDAGDEAEAVDESTTGGTSTAGVVLTALTLVAFAGNSLLCRMALGEDHIDPVSFTTLRLVSGALILVPLSRFATGQRPSGTGQGSWASGITLFVYAVAFSLAYVSLSTGMGALILFGTVQVTMVAAALRSGESLGPVQWTGLAVASTGLVLLVLPGLSAPDPVSAFLMGVAGVAWGFYSIRGRGASAPVAMTAGNFARAAPLAVLASLAAFAALGTRVLAPRVEPLGVLLAVTSGAVTSGIGYVLWYRALRRLTTTQASAVQLLVPVLAAFGGVAFLAEQVSPRLVGASVLILGGVALVVVTRGARARD